VLNLTDYLDRRPGQLSGGQRQRVAIGRAIVREPAAFLFDEPLSNLDAALRVGMRLEISELHKRSKTTMIYVTHDQVEAMTMADKIVVLQAGVIEQVGSPLELYQRPRNKFVAGFIGSPKMNFIDRRRSREARRGTPSASARNTSTCLRPKAPGRALSAFPNTSAPTRSSMSRSDGFWRIRSRSAPAARSVSGTATPST
jgi:multiple sugar transport system ATP-binding protein